MGRFLRENWLYIVAPFVILVVLLVVVALLNRDSATPFMYNLMGD